MGDYSFDQPLQIGQRLAFDDMAPLYDGKTTTFNGINLPSIAIGTRDRRISTDQTVRLSRF